MKKLILGLVLVLGLYGPVQADLINFGVDVKNDGTYSQVAGGFIGDDTGHYISGFSDDIVFTIVTTFAAGSNITGASLFIDATDVSGDDGSFWTFRVRWDDTSGSDWKDLGVLADTPVGESYIPVLLGPLGATTLGAFNDEDNTFFNTLDPLFPTILTSDLRLEIEVRSSGGDDARIDGANLQVQYTPPTSQVPEPTTMLLLGLGLVGLAVTRIRKKH